MKVKFEFEGHKIEISEGSYTNANVSTEAGKEFAKNLISKLAEMKKYAAVHLMDAYESRCDNRWPEDEHDTLTHSEFEANLTCSTIIILKKIGEAAVYFDDAGMFRDEFYLSIAIRHGEIVDVCLE